MNTKENYCSLSAPEKRLADCLNLLIQIRKNYFDPDQFRLSLNNCIQTLRTVTFVLQKQKNKFANFESWYAKWQNKMRKDQVLRWLVEARNKIVKEGDLNTLSLALATIVESWFGDPIFVMKVPPLLKTEEVADRLATTVPGKENLGVGLLRVERTWIDSHLPNHELFETLTHCFEFLTKLLLDAHKNLFLSEKERSDCLWYNNYSSGKELRPACAIASDWERTIWIDLKTGKLCSPAKFKHRPTKKDSRKAAERYGLKTVETLAKKLIKITDLEKEGEIVFNMAKTILVKDGFHSPMVFLGYPNGSKEIHQLVLEDRAAKHMLIRQLAVDIERTGATSFIMINEVWMAHVGEKEIVHAADSSKREEALMVTALNKQGEYFYWCIFFKKDKNGKVILYNESEIKDVKGDYPNFLIPILKVWSKS